MAENNSKTTPLISDHGQLDTGGIPLDRHRADRQAAGDRVLEGAPGYGTSHGVCLLAGAQGFVGVVGEDGGTADAAFSNIKCSYPLSRMGCGQGSNILEHLAGLNCCGSPITHIYQRVERP